MLLLRTRISVGSSFNFDFISAGKGIMMDGFVTLNCDGLGLFEIHRRSQNLRRHALEKISVLTVTSPKAAINQCHFTRLCNTCPRQRSQPDISSNAFTYNNLGSAKLPMVMKTGFRKGPKPTKSDIVPFRTRRTAFALQSGAIP